jgi:hypothetical protein
LNETTVTTTKTEAEERFGSQGIGKCRGDMQEKEGKRKKHGKWLYLGLYHLISGRAVQFSAWARFWGVTVDCLTFCAIHPVFHNLSTLFERNFRAVLYFPAMFTTFISSISECRKDRNETGMQCEGLCTKGCHHKTMLLRKSFANAEDTNLRRSHPAVFDIDVDLMPLPPPGPSAPPPIATFPTLPTLPLLRRLLLLQLSRIFRFCLSDPLSFMIPKSIFETF